jgi:hypothetical protein
MIDGTLVKGVLISCKQQIAADQVQHPPHPRSLHPVGGVICFLPTKE